MTFRLLVLYYRDEEEICIVAISSSEFRRRYWVGVIPKCFLKELQNTLSLENPVL